MNSLPYGYRILGACTGERRLVNADAAFRGHASCDRLAELESEAFLSAFRFGEDFKSLMESRGSCRGFDGGCWSPWIWFDIDRANALETALTDTQTLASLLISRYAMAPDELLIFFSGSKGFHLGVPTALWNPSPAAGFHLAARSYASHLANLANVKIDETIYDRVRAFRAPNSRHPKTKCHKIRLSLLELSNMTIDSVLETARSPRPFEIPMPITQCNRAHEDWLLARRNPVRSTAKQAWSLSEESKLNAATLDFVREGALEGERNIRLFSAAANLAEFGCPPRLAHALLTESALESGLSPREVKRQISCGLQHVAQRATATTIEVHPDCRSDERHSVSSDPADTQDVHTSSPIEAENATESKRNLSQSADGNATIQTSSAAVANPTVTASKMSAGQLAAMKYFSMQANIAPARQGNDSIQSEGSIQ